MTEGGGCVGLVSGPSARRLDMALCGRPSPSSPASPASPTSTCSTEVSVLPAPALGPERLLPGETTAPGTSGHRSRHWI